MSVTALGPSLRRLKSPDLIPAPLSRRHSSAGISHFSHAKAIDSYRGLCAQRVQGHCVKKSRYLKQIGQRVTRWWESRIS
jgi:hypothetical protein